MPEFWSPLSLPRISKPGLSIKLSPGAFTPPTDTKAHSLRGSLWVGGPHCLGGGDGGKKGLVGFTGLIHEKLDCTSIRRYLPKEGSKWNLVHIK